MRVIFLEGTEHKGFFRVEDDESIGTVPALSWSRLVPPQPTMEGPAIDYAAPSRIMYHMVAWDRDRGVVVYRREP